MIAAEGARGVRRLLDYAETAELLDEVGVRRPRERRIDTPGEAVTFAAEVGASVVLKLISPGLVHKSDVGAVRLDLRGPETVEAAATELIAIAERLTLGDYHLLGQEQLPAASSELLVGITVDPVFGPIVAVGPGGRFVELIRHVVVRQCPVGSDRVENMFADAVLQQLLEGFRGDIRWDVRSLGQLVTAASLLPGKISGFAELDLNPVRVDASGKATAVDARIIIGESEQVGSRGRAAVAVDALFEARSVVVVGASEQKRATPGNRLLRALRKHAYPGDVLVIHPRAETIEGYRAVSSPAALPGPVDLACIGVPARSCGNVLEQLSVLGLRAAIVFSSGFSDAGDVLAEAELRETAQRLGITLAGPNTVGLIDVERNAHFTFSQAEELESFEPGNIAIVAQSGALGGSLLTQAHSQGLGISAFASVGNQACVDIADYLGYFADHEPTAVVAVVLEGAPDGPRLLSALDDLARADKFVVVLKLGGSSVGSEAVRSHTGSLAGDAQVYAALMREHGAVVVDSLTALLDAAVLLSLPATPRGPRVGVLSTSGGACALVADACARHGLLVPEFSSELRDALGKILPAFSATRNPIDVTGQISADPSLYGRALRVVVDTPEVDAIVLMLTTIVEPQATVIAEHIADIAATSPKPILISWTIAPELAAVGLEVLRRARIPVFPDPLRAVAALGECVRRVTEP